MAKKRDVGKRDVVKARRVALSVATPRQVKGSYRSHDPVERRAGVEEQPKPVPPSTPRLCFHS